MKRAFPTLVFAAVLIASTSLAQAATDTAPITAAANIPSIAKLAVQGGSSISFTLSEDPDTTASYDDSVSISVKARSSSNVTLTIQASGDLTDGSNTIDISNMTVAGSGSIGFNASPQSLSSSSAVTVGTFSPTSNKVDVDSGVLTFTLANSWNYTPGTSYTASLTLTFTAP